MDVTWKFTRYKELVSPIQPWLQKSSSIEIGKRGKFMQVIYDQSLHRKCSNEFSSHMSHIK